MVFHSLAEDSDETKSKCNMALEVPGKIITDFFKIMKAI